MNEMLLQFIWQYSLYNPVGLKTANGEGVTIVHPGTHNHNAGPDFENAKIKIGNTTLVGNLEIHIKASDWRKHKHDDDKAYQNIILHVVYDDDEQSLHHQFPKIELKKHIPAYILERYTNLIQTTQPIPCAHQLANVNNIVKESWLNRLLAERWEEKLFEWKDLLEQTKGDWRNLLYWRLAANFGFKVNATPFLMLAISLPVNILAKHKDNLLQIEALMFGQAGMLDKDFVDDYPNDLKNEYLFLKQKYQLTPIPAHLWKFLRMRPPNFPTIRIAQFAALVHKSLHLFSKVIEAISLKEIHQLLTVTASDYWSAHYRFDEFQRRIYRKSLGTDSIDNIIINTIAPVQFLYAHFQGKVIEQQKAIDLLSTVNAENNKFITLWEENKWTPKNALQSQALLQLFHHYCTHKKCLDCAIGLNIIKSRPNK